MPEGAGAPDDLIELGAVRGAYGVRGWVRIAPFAVDGAVLDAVRDWWIVTGGASGSSAAGSGAEGRLRESRTAKANTATKRHHPHHPGTKQHLQIGRADLGSETRLSDTQHPGQSCIHISRLKLLIALFLPQQ